MNALARTAEPNLISTVDVRAFFETLRLRWWVIPVVLSVTIGLLAFQDSQGRLQPEEFFVSRSYQIPNPLAVLTPFEITAQTVSEYPSPEGQLLYLSGDEARKRVETLVGQDVEVEIPADYTLPFTLSCRHPQKEVCRNAIEAYRDIIGETRKKSFTAGLSSLRNVLSAVNASVEDKAAKTKLAAVEALLRDLDTAIIQIDSFEQKSGPTRIQTTRSTFLFGGIAGVIVALLILLQLTYTDRRIRTRRQLVRVTGEQSYLGTAFERSDVVADRRAAVALHKELSVAEASHIRFVPLRTPPAKSNGIQRLVEMAGKTSTVAKPFIEMTVADIAEVIHGEVDVLVVQRNLDLSNDLSEALTTMQGTNRTFAGVLLLD